MKFRTFLMTNDSHPDPIFNALMEHSILTGICTGLDKKKGRGQLYVSPAIKKLATSYNIAIYQAASIKNNTELEHSIHKLHIDFLIVYSYGFIVPVSLLGIPKIAALNIHPSLLPQYRGASPIQTALLHGDRTTGVTIQIMSPEVDCGDILFQVPTEILDTEDYTALHSRLAGIGASSLIEVFRRYAEHSIRPQAQNHVYASYCHKIHKQDGLIDWRESYKTITQKLKAYSEYPQSYTIYQGTTIIIHEIAFINANTSHKHGQIIQCNRHGIHVQCADAVLRILKLQKASGKVLSDSDFMNGNRWEPLSILPSYAPEAHAVHAHKTLETPP